MSQSNAKRRRQRRQMRHRRGILLVAVIVCMAVVMGIVGTLLRGALSARRQLRVDRDLRQVELLLDAGVDRAAAKLATDPDYEGETWSIPADEIINAGAGKVVIAIPDASPPADSESDDAPQLRQVHIAAEYPLGGLTTVRRSRTFLIED